MKKPKGTLPTNYAAYRNLIEAVEEKNMPKRKKIRRGVKMITRGFYLPEELFQRIDQYAEIRGGLSRNAAAEELFKIAFDGVETVEGNKTSISEALRKIKGQDG
ncbi:MAG: hypothetical protein GF334_07090 [Candidatus Altiarchaeales archaeon]|nr:hypothetical protein [Candidatus Altiarchaeales archaeon]